MPAHIESASANPSNQVLEGAEVFTMQLAACGACADYTSARLPRFNGIAGNETCTSVTITNILVGISWERNKLG